LRVTYCLSPKSQTRVRSHRDPHVPVLHGGKLTFYLSHQLRAENLELVSIISNRNVWDGDGRVILSTRNLGGSTIYCV
jgi:hypothetical protein